MFFKILISYITGYLRIEITGYYIERFINLCSSNKIATWNLKKGKDANVFLNIQKDNLKEAIKIGRKTKCKVKIKSKKGIPFLLHKYRKRKIFLICLLMILAIIGISSLFVWNIDVKEENGETVENIYQDLEEAGLKIGELKSNVNSKEIINKIRLKRNDIAWIGIEEKGTNIIVKIVKSSQKPEIINEEDYCNIISDKEGIITKITAQTGTAQVSVGDTIGKGTILIGGWMEGKYTGVRYVHAKGEIEAKVWYTKNTNIKYNTTETTKTGEEEKKYAIKFNDFKINFYKKLSKFEIYDTIETEQKIKIFSDFYLPISIVEIINKEEKKEQKTYNIEEAKNIGIKQLEEELGKEITNKEKIVNENINTYENEDSIDVYVTYEVIENIGTKEKIIF